MSPCGEEAYKDLIYLNEVHKRAISDSQKEENSLFWNSQGQCFSLVLLKLFFCNILKIEGEGFKFKSGEIQSLINKLEEVLEK